jgi:hypothetical protein
MSVDRAVEHPLGKGEVHSSILCGSTTKTHRIWLFASIAESAFGKYRQNETRSSRPNTGKIRGLCSRGVPCENPLTVKSASNHISQTEFWND